MGVTKEMKLEKVAKWKRDTLEQMYAYSNSKLLDETVSAAAGDDYDGCFTDRGEWKYVALRTMLEIRLGSWLEESLDETIFHDTNAVKAVKELLEEKAKTAK